MRKNRKLYLSLLIIVCLLCLGIGYAAITGTLTINGTISTAKADDLGNLEVYFVKATDITKVTCVKCEPSLTGTKKSFPEGTQWSEGYSTANIAITEFSQANSAFAKFIIYSTEESSNDVIIGYDVKITYTGDKVANINDYFEVLGYFDGSPTAENDYSSFDADSEITLGTGNACSFFVSVTMKQVPPVALDGITITITLTYDAK